MKRWPAFSLVEMAVILMISGVLLTRIPAMMNFYKTYETKQQIELAIKSLGACVAKNFPLPQPDPNLPRTDDEFILCGTLPYKELGIKRKGPAIRYAVDRALTHPKIHLDIEDKGGFCNLELDNHFATHCPKKDIIAFELSVDKIKVIITRNNFSAQYCGTVCKPIAPKPTYKHTPNEERLKTVKELSPEERDAFGSAL